LIKAPESSELAVAGGIVLFKVVTKLRTVAKSAEGTQHYLSEIAEAQHPTLKLMYPLGL
jgi:hypothetical protein